MIKCTSALKGDNLRLERFIASVGRLLLKEITKVVERFAVVETRAAGYNVAIEKRIKTTLVKNLDFGSFTFSEVVRCCKVRLGLINGIAGLHLQSVIKKLFGGRQQHGSALGGIC